ncbi:uncharacterized protein LOC130450890 [Diorhabda sublineata]|uniref:uncharacterized protein LOC130450890 n=1 Tax=Diorhabda sublineata TaxID=1163346 RepID=UPI0024E0B2AE|nr:uncharacterized protein LOC130450890 [Diorhabda sublineata]
MNTLTSDMSLNNSSGISFLSDWSNSWMAQELMSTRQQGLQDLIFLSEETNFNWSKKYDQYKKMKNKMNKSITKWRETKKEFDDNLNYYEQKLRPVMENITEKQNELIRSYKILNDLITQLKEEKRSKTAELKLESEANQRALNLFSNFDMKVNIGNISGDTIMASVTFGFSKETLPIEVVVDARKRKIMNINFRSSSNKSSLGDASGPKFLCDFRETYEK